LEAFERVYLRVFRRFLKGPERTKIMAQGDNGDFKKARKALGAISIITENPDLSVPSSMALDYFGCLGAGASGLS
jgi:hypothetical protein